MRLTLLVMAASSLSPRPLGITGGTVCGRTDGISQQAMRCWLELVLGLDVSLRVILMVGLGQELGVAACEHHHLESDRVSRSCLAFYYHKLH